MCLLFCVGFVFDFLSRASNILRLIWTSHIAEDSLGCLIPLPPLPKCRSYRHTQHAQGLSSFFWILKAIYWQSIETRIPVGQWAEMIAINIYGLFSGGKLFMVCQTVAQWFYDSFLCVFIGPVFCGHTAGLADSVITEFEQKRAVLPSRTDKVQDQNPQGRSGALSNSAKSQVPLNKKRQKQTNWFPT